MTDERDDICESTLTVTLAHGRGPATRPMTVTVTAQVVTIEECLRAVEDALRGAGYHVPHESIVLETVQ